MDGRRRNLKEFYFKIRECKKCGLWQTKTKFVFGSGNACAELLFIGEAPGKNEDLQGKPFVGRAGQILDELLESIGLARNEVFIANVLKCRPPRNRDPHVEEVEACRNYLFRQVEIINPKIICTLGKHSTRLILETDKGITGLRGKEFRVGGRIILPINHPAAVLYNPSKYKILEKDFARIKGLLSQGNSVQEEKKASEPSSQKPEQLGLF